MVSPQTKKVPNSSQNIGTCDARTSASIARVALRACRIAAAGGVSAVAPKRSAPMSAGCSGISSATSGIIAAQPRPTNIATGRHAPPSASHAISGRNTKAPVAVLAVSAPITRPCWVANQRFTTAAPSTEATAPDPMPEITPQVST